MVRGDELPPSVDWKSYDVIIVQATLREILNRASDHNPDLIHARALTDEDYTKLLTTATGLLEQFVSKTLCAIGDACQVLFLAFIEPPAAYQGILLNNRKKSLYSLVRSLNDSMATFLEKKHASHYIEINDLIRYFGDALVTDAYISHFSHAGFPWYSAKLAGAIITRVSHAMTIIRAEAPIKLIVTDLDNTLWKGVLAEFDDIVPHEHNEGWPLGYVEALLEFKRRGGLLAICSKNDHLKTVESFEKVWVNRLTLADFCSVKINWERKSKNIQEILNETNILPENTLFVDDNPREIAEVTRVFPSLRTLTDEQSVWRNVILYSPHTQVLAISEESAVRTEMLLAKQGRDQQSASADRDGYLRSLDIQAHADVISCTSHRKFPRAAELINKTNQFNTTGKRWSIAEFAALFASKGSIVTLNVSDKFGDNGLVAAAIVRGSEIRQIVMSCRVFGLGIELALISEAMKVIRDGRTSEEVLARFIDTGKNKTCVAFYISNSFIQSSDPEIWCTTHSVTWPDWITPATSVAIATSA